MTPVAKRLTVITLRIVCGAVFLFAGFAKLVDPWGGLIKITEYLAAMHIDASRPEVLIMACVLATAEFLIGGSLILGCLRRVTVWAYTAFMVIMTPLTLWLWLADPVADCGCFGEALTLSNGATFAKNIILLAAAVPLLLWNRQAKPAVTPALQWIAGAALLAYAVVVQTYGYRFQPLVDFRPFKVGTTLDRSAEVLPEYIYQKDGVTKAFEADALPDESWEFVSVQEPENTDATIVIQDSVGDDALPRLQEMSETPGGLLLLSVSEPRYHGISRQHMANALSEMQKRRHGSMAAVVAADDPEAWSRAVNAEFPVYTAEDTDLKMLARGDAALVYVLNDTIRWKYNLYSISPDFADATDSDPVTRLQAVEQSDILLFLTLFLVAAELLLVLLSHVFSRDRKKNVNICT